MSDNMIREKVSDALFDHSGASCNGLADTAIAAHLQALTDEGYAVVKLAESDSPWCGQPSASGTWTEDWQVWAPQWASQDNAVQVRTNGKVSPAEARNFAAALLAAANAAEAQS